MHIPPWSPKCLSTPDLFPRDTLQSSPVITPEGSPIPSPRHSPTRPFQTPTPTKSPETPSSLLTPRCLILHQASTNSRESSDSESDPIMMATTEVIKFDYNPEDANDKKGSMKYLFLARFTKEGRVLEAAYSAWGTLTFDINKDDIE